MNLETVALMSAGDMGQGVGKAIREGGRRVITNLTGRSERTRGLAEKSGLEDVGSLEALVSRADIVLSIMPPASAYEFAETVAGTMKATGRTPVFADLNAISPTTTKRIESVITAAGATYIDGGIVGSAPGKAAATRVYVSGREAEIMGPLACDTMRVIQMGPEIGRASAMKMLYSALNKGTWALQAAVLTAAEQYGLVGEVLEELSGSQPAVEKRMREWVGFLAADSHRWIAEMDEIADTLSAVGVTPYFHNGARDTYSLLAETPLASETRETWDRSRPLEKSIRIFAETLRQRAKAAE